MAYIDLPDPALIAHILREFSNVVCNPGTPIWSAARDAADACQEAADAEALIGEATA